MISTDGRPKRFEKLTAQVDNALATARDAKDAVVNSFDVLILRTEHRTNEIVKVLTLASILLLPGALIAGVMGMNVNFSADDVRALAALLGRRRHDRRDRARDARLRALRDAGSDGQLVRCRAAFERPPDRPRRPRPVDA